MGLSRSIKDRGCRVSQYDAPSRSQKKQKQRKGRDNSNSGADKKSKHNDGADGDGEYQFDGVISAISGHPGEKTKSSLKTDARAPQTNEPVNKRFKKDEAISFSDENPVPPVVPHHDAIIMQAVVANKLVRRIYIDSGAPVIIIFKGCFD